MEKKIGTVETFLARKAAIKDLYTTDKMSYQVYDACIERLRDEILGK